jgi:hypothetical protein
MIKLNSLDAWKTLDPDTGIQFNSKKEAERTVRIHLNLEAVTTFYIGKGKRQRLLATAGPGLETIEFSKGGDFVVYAEKGSGVVQYRTADGDPTHVVVPDPKTFTRIATRRTRNPELEEMMFRMNQNVERRLAAQRLELETQMLRMKEAENAAKQTDTAPTADATGQPEVSTQVPSGGEPAPATGTTDGSGTQAGAGDTTAGAGGAGN